MHSEERRRLLKIAGAFFAVYGFGGQLALAKHSPLSNQEKTFAAFLDAFETIALDIVTIAGETDLVLAERVDRFTLKNGGKYFELPVNGVFELKDGKIHRFSDYFDLQTFESRSGFKL